jgi:hypothetical protein
MNDIDERALDSMSVAPGKDDAPTQGDAGADASIAQRLKQNPQDKDARVDEGSDESMDASDPISAVQPGRGNDPAPSSGYDAEAEATRKG